MAFVNGFMTQGNPNSALTATIHNFEANPAVSNLGDKENLEKEGGGDKNCSNARPRQNPHHHRLFRSIEEELENDDYPCASSSSSTSLLAHMNKPSPSEIRQWMADTQRTVDKVVTSWQQQIIDRSSKVSELLDHLVKFVVELEEEEESQEPSSELPLLPSSPLLSIITAKCASKHGTFESVINVYLHLILISLKQVATTFEKQQGQEEQDHRKTKSRQKRQQRLLIEILHQFTLVAGDALKFLQTHDKILEPTCEKLLEMRNNLYYFLRMVIQQPQVQIMPPVSNVSLDAISKEEDVLWMERCCSEYRRREMKVQRFQEVDVEATNYSLVLSAEEGLNRLKDEDMSVNEGLELILLLLRQLDKSIGVSNQVCKGSQAAFSEVHTRLSGKFQRLVRNLIAESRQEKLNPENCSDYLKESLCQLEAKFHQVEKVLEEIPHHLRRVIAVADQCSRQLIQGFGLEQTLELEESPSWTSPIQDVSEEFFKSKKYTFTGCFPFLWKIIVKMILGRGGKSGSSSKKLAEFWEEVRTEMEQFLKEIKLKEMETGYAVMLRIPIDYEDCSGPSTESTSALAKYTSIRPPADLLFPKLEIQQLELEVKDPSKEADNLVDQQTPVVSPSHDSTSLQTLPPHQQQEKIAVHDNNPSETFMASLYEQLHQHKPILEGIVKEFKYISQEYNVREEDARRAVVVEFLEEPFSQKINVPSPSSKEYEGCSSNNDYICSISTDTRATVTHTDKLLLKKKLESYLVDVHIG